MASEAKNVSQPGSTAAAVIARLDRIPIWSLSYLFIGIIGLGFLFTFFDIFDINVSFIQTCTQIVPGCIPPTSANFLGLPIELNLAGYVIGALILAPIADRFGRRNLLLFTLILTGLGSLYNAFVPDYTNFVVARTITGLGIGADLALVNAYINEVAPNTGRARYTSLIFILSALGAFLGIWLGLILTTPPAPFPLGLSFAAAGPAFQGNGWRIMYGIGALLALVGVLLRSQLPESPRWLISRGRVDEADKIVADMEARALRRVSVLPDPGAEITVQSGATKIPYVEIFGNRLYLGRTILLLVVWFLS
ncbi:MAG: MFS transporter, partial [Ktedonobacteraceae bacterium]